MLLAPHLLKPLNEKLQKLKWRGDEFTKFGGGTKKLGDYFTDKKIPARLRGSVPLIADGSKILVVGGVEISDGVKITERTEKINYLICADYSAIK